MPPHCDSLDGPVVTVAREALDHEDLARVLPFVPADAEAEVTGAYDLTVKARLQGSEAREVADRWFYETVVRLHRAGEGAPEMLSRKQDAGEDVAAARRYVTAMLGLQVWAHKLAGAAHADPHGNGHEHDD